MQSAKCKVQNEESTEMITMFWLIGFSSDSRLGRHIAGQLVRSGTSPAPNYAEACGAESRKDFIHKLSICLKELRESRCWIQLIIKSELRSELHMADLQDECTQLCNIIGKSVVTAKTNQQPKTK